MKNPYVSPLAKRVFRPYMRFSEPRTHVQTLEWADEVEEGQYLDKYGITGKSIFFKLDGFDLIHDIPPEPMHLMDGGFMKNTMGRTFNSGTAHQTRVGYRRSSIAKLSQLIRYMNGRSK